ncbi:DUF2235 domain-containing protein [Pseudomonas sp. CDFA 602]|uniref:T6SS phospholipase effector Tle1-like catalytic domain-containing protein n=1 Tax=Pseudomonas californiensis TaxID=2829823 RepID=UPI001E33DD5E|nr:DUF2235 domain-containing protein [Pseudomonas californiensis]MCD5992747.1 DUF2235 domain-containing protein [Pseudomonas californiensis]MCD5998627.1 DUF2235 domain-containing protein [Pseudomonas californiensis]
MGTTRIVNPLTTVSETASLKVTARVGVFFDGTGNNRVNTRIGADCQALMEFNCGRHIAECAGRHLDPGSSYSNDVTNIARLAGLYRQQYIAANEGQGLNVYWPIYVSGAGTTSGGRDSRWYGQSFGRGSTGVVAKVEQSFHKLESRFKAFPNDNPACVIDALELDVFGFSRGAASARHFVNEILKQAAGMLEPILNSRKVRLSDSFSWSNGSVRIKVIGLFDTVAAIGSFKDLGNVRDSANRRVNLYLPPGCAQQVLHLVARDESRRNFALNSIQPIWPREIVLPGAHSDIGGGYPPQMQEHVLLTRPQLSAFHGDIPCEATSAWQYAQAELKKMDASQWVDPLDAQASLKVEACDTFYRARSMGSRSAGVAVCLQRQIFGNLSRVYLQVMHVLACAEGVPFEPVPCSPDFTLTPELEGIAGKLIDYSRGGAWGLTNAEEQMLKWRYIHHSAHWSAAIGSLGTLSDAVFVHAPEPGGRIRHPNIGQSGYPQ